MKNLAAIFVIFTSTVFHQCLCRPTGAPSSQCESMMPSHGVAGQTGPSPYEVKVNETYYMPGQTVKVSIESSTYYIKGFLIQARKVGENTVTGTFTTPPANTQYVTCNSNSQGAITHDQRLSMRTINFEWEPPMDLYGNISFYATVVKNYTTFWVKIQSPELYRKVTPEQNTTAAPTTEQAMEPIVYEDCIQAQEKTCYDSVNRVYSIKARTPYGYAPLECMDSSIVSNCPGSGWTRVGDLNGTSNDPDTSFHSDAWFKKSTSYGFNPGFWSAYVGEVCIDGDGLGFVLPAHAYSLRSLFFGKTVLDVNSTQLPGDFVDGCYEVGFNVGDHDFIQVRAGIVAVRNKTGCHSVPPAAVGIGIFNVTSPIMGYNGHGELSGLTFDHKDFIVAVRARPEEEPTGTAYPTTTYSTTSYAEETTEGMTRP